MLDGTRTGSTVGTADDTRLTIMTTFDPIIYDTMLSPYDTGISGYK